MIVDTLFEVGFQPDNGLASHPVVGLKSDLQYNLYSGKTELKGTEFFSRLLAKIILSPVFEMTGVDLTM